jgi:hypothetical protein
MLDVATPHPRWRRGLAVLVLAGGALIAADVAAASLRADAPPSPASEAVPSGGCVPFGDPCASGDRCCGAAGSFGVCHGFGRGNRCTITCPSDPADCPNDGRGCNNQSPPVCKTGRRKGNGSGKGDGDGDGDGDGKGDG